jgi:hypothetical protein
MTSRQQGRHVTAPREITLYKPAAVTFTRHRKPNRRPLGWHLDTLASAAVLRLGERMMRDRP